MTQNEKTLSAVIVALSLALPVLTHWAFKTGYRFYREVHTPIIIQVPPSK